MTGCRKLCVACALAGTIVLVFAGLSAMAPAVAAEEGSHGGTIYEGHEYKFVSTSATWTDAKSAAEGQGGHLVTITSAAENEFATSLLSFANAWIGLSDIASEGTFAWVTGESLTYTNWYYGEPNNFGGVEDAGQLYWANGAWNDADPSISCGYVIEWDSAEAEEVGNAILELCGLGFVGAAPAALAVVTLARRV